MNTWRSRFGRIQRLNRLLEASVRHFYAAHDLELGEADVLTTLRRAGAPFELTAGDLVRESMVTTGAINRIIE